MMKTFSWAYSLLWIPNEFPTKQELVAHSFIVIFLFFFENVRIHSTIAIVCHTCVTHITIEDISIVYFIFP